ncbi:MAG: hypothetical protein OHM56_01315 [Spiroplasma phoeniceum]|nr:MAG: hypothetical protein OHM57_00740 [Spiroplasma phoeniceum]UZQ32631.1 MAG: hypothetical protein OHM56_01315 [Spiroplasma phoeniceum]
MIEDYLKDEEYCIIYNINLEETFKANKQITYSSKSREYIQQQLYKEDLKVISQTRTNILVQMNLDKYNQLNKKITN